MIYFLRCEVTGRVKIGYSEDERSVVRRVRGLSLSSPTPLALVSLIDGGIYDERLLHSNYAHMRVRGEWFAPGVPIPPPAFLSLMKSINRGGPVHRGGRAPREQAPGTPEPQRSESLAIDKALVASVVEVADVLHVTPRVVRRWCDRRMVPSAQIIPGVSNWLISREWLTKTVENIRAGGGFDTGATPEPQPFGKGFV